MIVYYNKTQISNKVYTSKRSNNICGEFCLALVIAFDEVQLCFGIAIALSVYLRFVACRSLLLVINRRYTERAMAMPKRS